MFGICFFNPDALLRAEAGIGEGAITDPFERFNRAESETAKVAELQAQMKEMAK